MSRVNTNTESRNLNIDLIKIIAMLGVIMLHSTHNMMSHSGWDLASFMYKSAVVSIPLFFMVSGYLLLGRSNLNYRYIAKKILNIFKYTATFTTIFWLFTSIINFNFSINRLLYIFIGGLYGEGPFYVFWYFSAISIIYIILPPLNRLYIKSFNNFNAFLMILISIQNIVFLHILQSGGSEINTIFRLYNWLPYFMMGGLIKKLHLKQNMKLIWLVLTMCFINFLMQVYFMPFLGTNYCSIFYSPLPVIIFTIGNFMYILSVKIKKDSKIIRTLSKLFLPVFTIHSFFIGKITEFVYNAGTIAPLLCWILISLISIIISYIILKIPYSSKIVKI